ncbi:hypothetical protein FRC10_003166 [Ceratobasidium sp. 414]|nr:hypothetical protein FRC10_003166 [Ceratobasidium sp. 414]
MPPKRSNPSGSAGERPAKKAATGGSKATAGGSKASTPRLKKATQPNWDKPKEYSHDKPAGEWGANERSALDKVNTSESEESKPIVSEELGQDTWAILRGMSGDAAAAIFGSTLDDEPKKRIGRTLLGSLYFTELWGNDEGDGSPREVRAKSRLYSPFGLGTSIDLSYSYHLRRRMTMKGERFASLYVNANTIASCDAKNPRRCRAMEPNARGVNKAAPDAITVFDRNGGKSKGTTVANIKTFEEPLFGCEGWLSPLKLTNILFAAAGVMRFQEDDTETPKSTLAKFQLFQGESDGRGVLKQELVKLAKLEKEANQGEDGDGICIPQRLLLLAQQDADAGSGHGEKSEEE